MRRAVRERPFSLGLLSGTAEMSSSSSSSKWANPLSAEVAAEMGEAEDGRRSKGKKNKGRGGQAQHANPLQEDDDLADEFAWMDREDALQTETGTITRNDMSSGHQQSVRQTYDGRPEQRLKVSSTIQQPLFCRLSFFS